MKRRKILPGHRPALCECDGFLRAASEAQRLRPDVPRSAIVAASKLCTARVRWLYSTGFPVTEGDVLALALGVLSVDGFTLPRGTLPARPAHR